MAIELGATLREPSAIIHARRGLFDLELKGVWQHRELLYFLLWRDVIIRFKQTVLGVGWIILQPIITMVVFTLIFGNLAKIPSDGIPYPIFAFSALLPWGYFSQALARTSGSVVNNSNLVTKIYFPRLLIPLSASLGPVLDFFFSFLVLLALMVWFKITPTWGLLALPVFLCLAIITAMAVGLWFSALNVKYRDVGSIIPFVIQMWMYASPVAYPVSLVPEKWRLLYSLNPMVGVIEGFRWALLGKESPDFVMMSISASVVFVLFFSGLVYFKKAEETFADII